MTLGITSKAKAMIADGRDVANMCAGEPDFDTPRHIKEAAAKALDAGDTKYTPVAGRPELREAVAAKFSNENGLHCSAQQIVVSPGAKFSVFATVAVLCGPGDEVILPKPYWLSYAEMVLAAGATPVFMDTALADGFCLDPAALEEKVTERTKLLVLNTPSNPAGGVYRRSVLEAIAELAVRHDFMVLADEIYEKLVYESDFPHVSIGSLGPEIEARTITVNGFSKAYSMTGWRLGYLAAPEPLAKAIAALQSHSTSNAVSFAQAGALAALTGAQEPVEEMRQAFAKRRDEICRLLHAIPGMNVFVPRGAFYVFPDISAFGLDSMTFAERSLEEANVAVIPGKPFGMDTNIRLSYACSSDTIQKACGRLAEFCGTLR
ncbi:MAG: pyridoxal phosphate-dependent aminotransferase [Candidatus Pacebacteria bacterium]|nr:pyridoxal phosphate-dependent aminotransferase [Candidatus Paceibacterota bacterium]